MSIILVCDVCDKRMKQKEENNTKKIFSERMLEKIADTCNKKGIDDICPICVNKITEGALAIVRNLALMPIPTPPQKKRKLPKGITRNCDVNAGHAKSRQMRVQLCQLVDQGTYTRKTLCAELYKSFPNYKSANALDPRISDLMNKDKAIGVTGHTICKGKIAMKDKRTGCIVWRPKYIGPKV